jgi:hypothetical protein
MSVHLLSLEICILNTSTYMVPLPVFLGINQIGPGMSSTANQRSNIAMRQLHGP